MTFLIWKNTMNEEQNNQKSVEEYKKEYTQRLINRANKKFAEKKTEPVPEQKSFIEKAKSFASSVASRGLSNNKSSQETKQLRMLSCHGDNTEALPPCGSRRNSSKYEGSFYCGACGCGDKKGTQLVNLTVNGEEQYCKLDYPKVSCPLKMPGFTDYVPDSEQSHNSRKKEIENRHGVVYITEHSNPK